MYLLHVATVISSALPPGTPIIIACVLILVVTVQEHPDLGSPVGSPAGISRDIISPWGSLNLSCLVYCISLTLLCVTIDRLEAIWNFSLFYRLGVD
jgi:hypothetical protein